MDYTELVKSLRICTDEYTCVGCIKNTEGKDYCDSINCDIELVRDAADAIERLSMKLHGDEAAIAGMKPEIERMVVTGVSCWIPVTERWPEPGVPCLCWCKGGAYGQIRWYGLYYLKSHRTWAFYDNDCIDNKEVTHWMYRPEPPKEET